MTADRFANCTIFGGHRKCERIAKERSSPPKLGGVPSAARRGGSLPKPCRMWLWNHPACSRGSQAPLLTQEGSFPRCQIIHTFIDRRYRRTLEHCEHIVHFFLLQDNRPPLQR